MIANMKMHFQQLKTCFGPELYFHVVLWWFGDAQVFVGKPRPPGGVLGALCGPLKITTKKAIKIATKNLFFAPNMELTIDKYEMHFHVV